MWQTAVDPVTLKQKITHLGTFKSNGTENNIRTHTCMKNPNPKPESRQPMGKQDNPRQSRINLSLRWTMFDGHKVKGVVTSRTVAHCQILTNP